MTPTAIAYLIRDGQTDYICVISPSGGFTREPIAATGIARLGKECAERLWDEVGGKYGAPSNP